MEPAPATAPWLPPGGSCHDEISALRNRYFVVTDEGWRWLKVIDYPVKWYKPKQMPLIQLHLFTDLSPPLIRLFYQPVPKCRLIKKPASPRGKPRTQKILATTIQRTALLRELRVARLAPPTGAFDHRSVHTFATHTIVLGFAAFCCILGAGVLLWTKTVQKEILQ